MIKSELINAICHEQAHLSESDVTLCINTVFDKIIDHLAHGGRVEIRNFGNFDVRRHESRISHNPKTGKKFTTKPKHVIHFKPGKALKESVNASRHLPIKEANQEEAEE
jgi:integration host factor subunit beta